jgi:hypothetical protein
MKLLIIICVFFTLITSCDTLKGHRGISGSIEEAENNGVLLTKYQNLSLNFQKKSEIWLEKEWYHGGFYQKNKVKSNNRIIFKFDKPSFAGYDTTWTIKYGKTENCECNSQYQIVHCFVGRPLNLDSLFYVEHNIIQKMTLKKID